MSCLEDLRGSTLPTETDTVNTFLERCAPSATPGPLGCLAPAFARSATELEAAAAEWVRPEHYDGRPSMLDFGRARGLSFGAWQLDAVPPADVDKVWVSLAAKNALSPRRCPLTQTVAAHRRRPCRPSPRVTSARTSRCPPPQRRAGGC